MADDGRREAFRAETLAIITRHYRNIQDRGIHVSDPRSALLIGPSPEPGLLDALADAAGRVYGEPVEPARRRGKPAA